MLLSSAPEASVLAAGTVPVAVVAGTSGLAVDAPVVDASVEVAPGSACIAVPVFTLPDVGVVWLFPAGFEYGTMLFVAILHTPHSQAHPPCSCSLISITL